jgi:hypothetical protein
MARAQQGMMLNVSSMDELRQHHHVLEPTPPLPTQPSVSVMSPATALGSTTTMPATLHPRKLAQCFLVVLGVIRGGALRR